MKKTSSILIAVSITAALGISAMAQTSPRYRTPHINHQQHEQQKRIRQGIRSGELTRAEAIRLEKEEREIRQGERAAKADGVVTRAERREINQDLNKASRHIYRAKHNRRDRN